MNFKNLKEASANANMSTETSWPECKRHHWENFQNSEIWSGTISISKLKIQSSSNWKLRILNLFLLFYNGLRILNLDLPNLLFIDELPMDCPKLDPILSWIICTALTNQYQGLEESTFQLPSFHHWSCENDCSTPSADDIHNHAQAQEASFHSAGMTCRPQRSHNHDHPYSSHSTTVDEVGLLSMEKWNTVHPQNLALTRGVHCISHRLLWGSSPLVCRRWIKPQ